MGRWVTCLIIIFSGEALAQQGAVGVCTCTLNVREASLGMSDKELKNIDKLKPLKKGPQEFKFPHIGECVSNIQKVCASFCNNFNHPDLKHQFIRDCYVNNESIIVNQVCYSDPSKKEKVFDETHFLNELKKVLQKQHGIFLNQVFLPVLTPRAAETLAWYTGTVSTVGLFLKLLGEGLSNAFIRSAALARCPAILVIPNQITSPSHSVGKKANENLSACQVENPFIQRPFNCKMESQNKIACETSENGESLFFENSSDKIIVYIAPSS